MMKQVSAGGVMVRGGGSAARVCLIARQDGPRRVWCLPKGHLEPGETLQACALREVREETGLTGAVVADLGAIAYTFAVPPRGTRISKTVHFYLMRYQRGRLDGHDDEVEEVAWFPIADARKRLAYPGERRILLKAQRFLYGGLALAVPLKRLPSRQPRNAERGGRSADAHISRSSRLRRDTLAARNADVRLRYSSPAAMSRVTRRPW